jgi:hypothetical protein
MIDQVVSKAGGEGSGCGGQNINFVGLIGLLPLCGSKTNILLDHVSMQLCGREQDSWYQGVPLLQPDSQP